MKNYRAVLFLFIVLFFFEYSFSQFIVDPTVESRYKEVVKKVPEEFQIAFKKKDEPGLSKHLDSFLEKIGWGIYTHHRLDTLNKEDLFPHAKTSMETRVEILSYDSASGKYIPDEQPKKYAFSDGRNTYLPMYTFAVLKNDSLQIDLPIIWEPQIKTIVTPKSVSAVYWDYRKYDSVFKVSLQGPKVNEIHLPMKIIHFSLSTNHYKTGDTVYGEAELETPVFYEESSLYKTGYSKQRLYVKYVFQIIILSPEEKL